MVFFTIRSVETKLLFFSANSSFFQKNSKILLFFFTEGWQLCSSHAGARGLIGCLRKFFDTFGVPEELSSDGGPEFTAGITTDSLKKWGVQPRISSAYNPQSNGRAEVAVKTAKRLLRNNVGPTGSLDNDKLLRALLQIRNTPDPDCNLSPAQIIYGRPIRDAFGFSNRLQKYSNPHVLPMWREAWATKESALRTRFVKTSEKLNEHSRNLPPLTRQDRCFIQNQTGNAPYKWERTGTVVEVLPHDKYIVKVDGSGRLTTRNRRFLRKFMSASPNINLAAPLTLPPPVTSQPEERNTADTRESTPNLDTQIPIYPTSPDINLDNPVPSAPDPPNIPTQVPPASISIDKPQMEPKIPLALKRLQSHNKPGLNEEIVGKRGGRH